MRMAGGSGREGKVAELIEHACPAFAELQSLLERPFSVSVSPQGGIHCAWTSARACQLLPFLGIFCQFIH